MSHISKTNFTPGKSNLCWIFLSLCLSYGVKGQDNKLIDDELLFSRTQIGLNFTGSLSHFIVNPQSGPNEPWSSISPGFQATIDFGFNFDKAFGLQIGLGGGFQNYNYVMFKTYDPYGGTSYSGSGSEIGYLTVPIEFIARKRISDRLFLYGGAGFTIRLYDANDGYGFASSGDSSSKDFVKMSEITSSGPLFMMIPKADIGFLWQLPYNDLIKIGLSLDIGQFTAYTSTYKYFDYKGNSTGSGSYIADASFVGLNIGYVFTRVRSR
jgi:hypothetical protein